MSILPRSGAKLPVTGGERQRKARNCPCTGAPLRGSRRFQAGAVGGEMAGNHRRARAGETPVRKGGPQAVHPETMPEGCDQGAPSPAGGMSQSGSYAEPPGSLVGRPPALDLGPAVLVVKRSLYFNNSMECKEILVMITPAPFARGMHPHP